MKCFKHCYKVYDCSYNSGDLVKEFFSKIYVSILFIKTFNDHTLLINCNLKIPIFIYNHFRVLGEITITDFIRAAKNAKKIIISQFECSYYNFVKGKKI